MVTAGTQPRSGRHWLLLVSALSLPSLAFVPLHRFIVVGYYGNSPSLVSGPTRLDAMLLWLVFVTGISGGWLALAALVAAVIGSFRRDVRRSVKVMTWSVVVIAAFACVYILRVPNLMALVQ
jgi:hypothetical protein